MVHRIMGIKMEDDASISIIRIHCIRLAIIFIPWTIQYSIRYILCPVTFLLLLGSNNFTTRRNVVRYFKFLNQTKQTSNLNLNVLFDSCENMAKTKTGAIIVLQRSNSLDFTLTENNSSNIKLMPQILESIFFKNSPLHDGAIIIEKNNIIATRVVLPVSDSTKMPSHYGLRHRAAQGISEKTDALVLVISEQTGKIVYVKNGEFFSFDSTGALRDIIAQDLSE